MRNLAYALLAMACSVTGTAFAEDEQGPWSGSVAFGYLSSSGNTDDTSAELDFDVAYTVKPWTHEFKARAYGASKDNDATAEAYKAGWKSKYDFNEFDYAFGALDWNKDRFSGYERQSFATVGYGRRILNSDEFVLNLEVGAGYTKQRSAEIAGPPLVPAESTDGAAGTLGGDFTWNFSENASFHQTLYIFTASDNTFWESVSKVKASLIGSLSLAVGYTVKQNTDVPVGTEKKDTLTSITLDYSF